MPAEQRQRTGSHDQAATPGSSLNQIHLRHGSPKGGCAERRLVSATIAGPLFSAGIARSARLIRAAHPSIGTTTEMGRWSRRTTRSLEGVSDPGRDDGAVQPVVPVYALGSNPAELDRLRRQSEELRAHSAELLDRVGIARGQVALDLGCGPSGILDLLADRVGPQGRVTGLEFNPASVTLAREHVAQLGLANVTVMQGDARATGLPSSSFDLVHARTLLINLPDPGEVVAEMARLTRPGGWVAALEPDAVLTVCYPPHPAWDQLVEMFLSVHRGDNADPFIGRRFPELFRQAGLTDIGVAAKADIYPPGHSRRTIRLDLVHSMRPKILDRGIANQQELDEVERAARNLLGHPDTLVLPHLLFLAWARKPLT
jgi:ubiquinone/menaquinone biosynthesis C-methylase UbiE